MARLEDEDGIDGPFERGMRRAMREDRKAEQPAYPHTLTSEQFAIISVALDSSREREAAYVAQHDDRPDDHLKALDELRRLWAFAGPIVLNARRSR